MKKEYKKPLIEEVELCIEDIMIISGITYKFESFEWGGDIVDEIF